MNFDWKILKYNWDILAIGIGYPVIMLITGMRYPSFNAISLFLFVIVGLLLVILRMLSFRYASFYAHEWKLKIGRVRSFIILAVALVLSSIVSSLTVEPGLLRESLSLTLLYAVVILFYADIRQHYTARRSTISTYKPRNPEDLN